MQNVLFPVCLLSGATVYYEITHSACFPNFLYYLLLTDLYLYGRIQRPRPAVILERREGIARAAGFKFARIDRQASQQEVNCLTKISVVFSILEKMTEAIIKSRLIRP